MAPRARLATSLLSIAAIAAIAVLLVAGTGGSAAAPPPCGGATDDTYLSTALTVALRISTAERTGVAVERAVDTIEADRVLAQAVASGDLATVHSETHVLVYNHQHIVRLRVMRGGQVLDDVGGPLVLSPVSGSLRVHGGRVVGTFVMSVQDDLGYRLLAQRLIGAHTVFRYQGATIMSNISVGSAPLPDRGSVIVGAHRYVVASFAMGHFPTGELRVSLLMRRPAAALARQSCAQVRADALAAIAQRAYGEAKTGPSAEPARTAIVRAVTLPGALAAGDDAAVASIVNTLVGAGGFARLRVVAGGRVVADSAANTPLELVAPTSRALVDAGGRVVGHAVFAVQSARGYALLAGYLTHAPVFLRAGARQIAGPSPGPATLPASGPITYLGVRYVVASFPGVLFPDGPMTVYVLGPA